MKILLHSPMGRPQPHGHAGQGCILRNASPGEGGDTAETSLSLPDNPHLGHASSLPFIKAVLPVGVPALAVATAADVLPEKLRFAFAADGE